MAAAMAAAAGLAVRAAGQAVAVEMVAALV
jgi:hypothetical protein